MLYLSIILFVVLSGRTVSIATAKLQSGLVNIWNNYNSALVLSPVITKSCTSAVGFCLGDLMAQALEHKYQHCSSSMRDDVDKRLRWEIEQPIIESKYDALRTLRMTSFGFLLHGPLCHLLFGFLETQFPGNDILVVLMKIAIDQVISKQQ